jgi:hypothetical protein
VLDAPVPHIALYCAGIEALVCKIKPAGVTEHVRVNAERESSQFTCSCDNLSNNAWRDLKSLIVKKYMLASRIRVLDNLQNADDIFL